jgi:hypothetical protein
VQTNGTTAVLASAYYFSQIASEQQNDQTENYFPFGLAQLAASRPSKSPATTIPFFADTVSMVQASPLANIRTPEQVTLRLRTLTPLYTGGIGQFGDQLHPSGILGSIRNFSCLVANTLGEADFERKVWGYEGNATVAAAGKQVSLLLDATALQSTVLPGKVELDTKSPTHDKSSTWYFNQAFSGELSLTLTRRGISDRHWQILLLALRIQIRHATFGAKDQFGLGVLQCDRLPAVTPLAQVPVEPIEPSLHRCAFLTLGLEETLAAKRNRSFGGKFQSGEALKLGLSVRHALRNALRHTDENHWSSPDKPDPKGRQQISEPNLRNLRHRLMGSLNEAGSAVDISAAYASPTANGERLLEIRVLTRFLPRVFDGFDTTQQAPLRGNVLKSFKTACKLAFSGNADWQLRSEPGVEYGAMKKKAELAAWLNTLAGVTP